MDARDIADRIAETYGGRPERVGSEWRVRCPVHEAEGVHTPSLAVWNKTLGVGLNCMVGCKWREVVEALKGRGIDIGHETTPHEQLRIRDDQRTRRHAVLAEARELYAQCRPIEIGGPVDRYLRSRRLELNEHERRFLLEAPGSVRGERLFCGLIVNPQTMLSDPISLVGIQTMPVTMDGKAVLGRNGKKWRQIVGLRRSYGVPLGPFRREMVVGEGIETTLALMRLRGIGFGMATLSSSNIPLLAIPPTVTTVHIAIDDDKAGIEAAKLAMATWRNKSIEVGAVLCPGGDAADHWVKTLEQKETA